MKIIYGVPWIEIESGWGWRPSGWKLFDNLKTCIRETKEDNEKGNFEGGYIGPIRPITYYEIPFDSLETELKDNLLSGITITGDFWNPKFKGDRKEIK